MRTHKELFVLLWIASCGEAECKESLFLMEYKSLLKLKYIHYVSWLDNVLALTGKGEKYLMENDYYDKDKKTLTEKGKREFQILHRVIPGKR